MRILVTGANGYLGSGVVKQLLDDGNIVIAAACSNEYIDERAVFKEGDIFKIDNPFEYYLKPEKIVHLAWKNGFVHNSIYHLESIIDHYNFINKMYQSGLKAALVLGSVHEIGFYEGSVDENTPCFPQSNYGIGKNALRLALQILSKQENAIFQWVRGYYIVSNSINGCSIFSKIAIAENNGEKEFPFTMGENQFDFIDYEEFCYQIAKIAEQNAIKGIINACSGKPEKLATKVEQFIKDNNYNIKLKYGAFPDRPYDSKAIWGANKKILEILKENEK